MPCLKRSVYCSKLATSSLVGSIVIDSVPLNAKSFKYVAKFDVFVSIIYLANTAIPHAPPSLAVCITRTGLSKAAAKNDCATFSVLKMPP